MSVRNVVLPFLFGATLAAVGFPITTWQYWVLTATAIAWAYCPKESK